MCSGFGSGYLHAIRYRNAWEILCADPGHIHPLPWWLAGYSQTSCLVYRSHLYKTRLDTPHLTDQKSNCLPPRDGLHTTILGARASDRYVHCYSSQTRCLFIADPPDSISLHEFMRNETYGRQPISKSRNPFTCGITGKSYSVSEAHQRADFVARALAKRLDFLPNEGVEWDKVVATFSVNTVRYEY